MTDKTKSNDGIPSISSSFFAQLYGPLMYGLMLRGEPRAIAESSDGNMTTEKALSMFDSTTVDEVADRIIEKANGPLEAIGNDVADAVAECIVHRIELSLEDKIELGVYRALERKDHEAKMDQRRAKAQLDKLTVKAAEMLLDSGPAFINWLTSKPGY